MNAYVIRISLDCPHCRSGVPVNGFTNEVLCGNCLKAVELGDEWWTTMLDPETIEEALKCEPGHANTAAHLGGMGEKIDTGNRHPRCQECKTDFVEETIQAAVAQGHFNCPGCQAKVRVRKATPLALSVIPEADLLLNEDEMGTGLGSDGTKAAEPVMFACLACGGGLKVDGSTRMVNCTHCASSNYLPDALWLRLHPAATAHVFFVTHKGPQKVTLEELPAKMSAEKAQSLLKDVELKPDVIAEIFSRFPEEEDVVMAVAKHNNTPPAVISKIVEAGTDHSYDIRVAIAKRRFLNVNDLKTLSLDGDSDVKQALVNHPDFFATSKEAQENVLSGLDLDDLPKALGSPSFPEWKLIELADNTTPADARKILRSPAVTLRVLRILGQNPTSRSIIKEHRLYKELSWFRKLFFFG